MPSNESVPFFSIVIANYNYGRFLEEAILSILNQSCQDFELIIVDGGSTDSSLEIVQGFSDRLGGVRFSEEGSSSEVLKCESSKVLKCESSKVLKCEGSEVLKCESSKVLKCEDAKMSAHETKKEMPSNSRTLELPNFRTRFLWCSEKDRGQSHAFNKGFAQAKGRFLTWLNADDLLMPGTLAAAKNKLLKNPSAKWMTGNVFSFTSEGIVAGCRWGPWSMPAPLQGPGGPVAVYGPTSFFSRELFNEVGGMDESFHFVMDTDLWIRFMVAGERYLRLNHFCWAFRMHELSKTAEFGDHQLVQSERDKLLGESKRSFEKNGYRYSRWEHVPQLLWRFVTLSEIKSKYMAIRWKGRSMEDFITANCRAGNNRANP